jgi:chromosome segregation ATPase
VCFQNHNLWRYSTERNAKAAEAELLMARRAKDAAKSELGTARRELAACDKRRRRAEDDAELLRRAVEQQRLDFRAAMQRAEELERENARVLAENDTIKDELVALRKKVKQIVRGAKQEAWRAQDGGRDAEARARAAEEASGRAVGEANVLKEMVGTLQIELRRLQQMNAQLRKRLKTSEHQLAYAQQQQGRSPSSLSGSEGARPPTSATHVTDVSSNYRG